MCINMENKLRKETIKMYNFKNIKKITLQVMKYKVKLLTKMKQNKNEMKTYNRNV